jgi:methylmalonyl-CoA mutase cobalamin-binding subunit
MQKTVIAAAIGECVHVAGIARFLNLAEQAGWRTVFLGPAVPVEEVLRVAEEEQAEMVGVSYRLTPENGELLLAEFAEQADDLRSRGVRFAFGGTPPVAQRAKALGFFDGVFDGREPVEELIAFLRGGAARPAAEGDFPHTTLERIAWKAPMPLVRHHFGLPDLRATLDGVAEIADSGIVDVISLGIDQDAQENFFHPERQDPRRKGAGGVAVRSPEDYRALYQASRRGNFPLMRTYTGTDDFLRLAEMYVETIHIAWPAVPLFWFNRMDGRGPWSLHDSLVKHQELLAWYGERGSPVELNEAHHWGMRSAPDVVSVAAGYLAAYNARAFGVRDHIVQMMFNSPAGLSDRMDLAKMLATLELIEELAGPDFRILRQTRTGLLSYPTDFDAARNHLASSVYVQMALQPHIVHVVGYTEADHAATGAEVIESCKLARAAIQKALDGQPDLTADSEIQARAAELAGEARLLLETIAALAGPGVDDPLADAATLARAVAGGWLDAPELQNNPEGRGAVRTRLDERGACVAVDPESGKPLAERERLARLAEHAPA